MKKLALMSVLLVIIAGSANVSPSRSILPPSRPIVPIMEMYGADTRITEEKVFRITSRDVWQSIWCEHCTGKRRCDSRCSLPETIEVDFDRMMIIALFIPNRDNSDGLSSYSVIEDSYCIRIRLDEHSYQSGSDTPTGCPWGIIVLPRSDKPVVLERDAQIQAGGFPIWVYWRCLPPDE